MPPKKKAGGSGSLSESQGKGAILQIFNQLDQDKINALSKRVDEAVSERMELQKKLDKGEKETQKLADYFQQELDLKDVLVGKQRLELKEAETKLEEKVAELTESYDEKIKTMEEDWNRTETGLRARLRIVEENLQRLESFRQSQKQVEKEVSQLKAAAEETARKHKVDLADLERHFLMDKAKTQAAFEDRINNLRVEEEMRLEAGRDAETKRIIKENKRVKDELRYQQEITDELNADKRRTAGANKRLGRELALLEDKEVEYARQGKAKTKEIHILKEKTAELEAVVSELKKKLQTESDAASRVHKRQVDQINKESDQLRQLIILKNKELVMLRTHAQTILDQRTEVEQYFIDALDQCKQAIQQEKEEEYRKSLSEYRIQMKLATQSEMNNSNNNNNNNMNTSYKKKGSKKFSPNNNNNSGVFNKTELGMGGSGGGDDSFGRSLASAFAPPQGGPAYVGTPLTGGGGGGTNIPVRSLNTPPTNDNNSLFPSIRPGLAQRGPLDGAVSKHAMIAAGVGGKPSALPVGAPPAKVQLGDLDWVDRERVLRILFAKINGVQGTMKKMPEHSLTS